jgi:Rhs element Vgr protein
VHPHLVQNQATDWDFIVSRAESNSQVLLVSDNEVRVMKPLLDQEPVLSLNYGATILDFEASIDARTQFQESVARSWDYEELEMAEAEGADPGFEEPGNLAATDLAGALGQDSLVMQHTGQLPRQELQSWANASLLRSRLAKIQGRVSFQGFAGVKPGDLLELNGVGDRFNGNVYISGTRHEIGSGNWTTHAQIGLSPEWLTTSARTGGLAAAGLLPAVHGLQTGIVTSLSDDPDDMARVKVRTPHISEDDDGIWARVAAPDAGDGRGLFFRPEISDEVVLGFMNDDPRSPVVLGMLHSSSKPAPILQDDDNHEKGYVSREEMKLVFNDDLKSIRVETPDGNVIQLSEDEGGIIIEDENGNKIQLSSEGITMETTADLNIKSDGDVNIEGININLKASAAISAEGSASASVSSGGTTEIKGSLIQIN